jgi:hypothetical protein
LPISRFYTDAVTTSGKPATTIAGRLLDVIDRDILPLTERGVAQSNKVFGAAILRKSDLSLVIAGTNDETVNPLCHGEVRTLNRFYDLSERPATQDLIFLAAHEPCTLCMSASPGPASTISTTFSATKSPGTASPSRTI